MLQLQLPRQHFLLSRSFAYIISILFYFRFISFNKHATYSCFEYVVVLHYNVVLIRQTLHAVCIIYKFIYIYANANSDAAKCLLNMQHIAKVCHMGTKMPSGVQIKEILVTFFNSGVWSHIIEALVLNKLHYFHCNPWSRTPTSWSVRVLCVCCPASEWRSSCPSWC